MTTETIQKTTEITEGEKAALAFLQQHTEVKKSDNPDHPGTVRAALPTGKYYDYMSTAGVERRVVDAVHEADANLTRAAVRLAGMDLGESIANAQRDGVGGDDIKKLTSSMSVFTPTNKVVVRGSAHRTGRNPQTGEATESFGAVQVRISPRNIYAEASAAVKTEITGLLSAG